MADSVHVVGCLEKLKNYYEQCGHEMKSEAKKLNNQFKKQNIAQIINRLKQTESDKKTMRDFIDLFKKHYVGLSSAKVRAKELAKDLSSNESVFDRFLQSFRDSDGAKATQAASKTPYYEHPPQRRDDVNLQANHVTGVDYKSACERLQRELNQLKASQKTTTPAHRYDYKSECERLQRELQQLKASHKTTTPAHRDPEAERQIAELYRQNEKLVSHIKDRDQHIRELKDQIEDYSIRLSTEMNTKISANESQLENISVENRPMKVSDDYQHVFTSEWMDAKTALDKAWKTGEKDKSKYLCHLVLETYARCCEIKDRLTVYLQEPVVAWTQKSHDKKAAESLSAGLVKVRDTVLDYWKIKGSAFQVPSGILQEIIEVVSKGRKVPGIADLRVYVEAVFRLCWNMVVQKPPMTLDSSGVGDKWRGDRWQDIGWGSKDPSKGKVQCYIYPTLKHADQIMVRGKVLIL